MKMISALILLSALLRIHASAHSIQSFTVIPANPTTNDTVRIVITCVFTSGACEGEAYLGNISGNQINASGSHCVGMLTYICTDYDTVVIPPLAEGQYNFTYTLSTGEGFPCTPGIVPDDIDSVNFTVSLFTGINTISTDNFFSVYPSPSSGAFFVKQEKAENSFVKIFSSEGKLVNLLPLNTETAASVFLPPGIYTVIAENEKKYFVSRITIVR